MSPRITVHCDRCGKAIEGWEDPGVGMSGFYRRDEFWGQFMDEGENVLCDACMQADPSYQDVYPPLDEIKDVPQ